MKDPASVFFQWTISDIRCLKIIEFNLNYTFYHVFVNAFSIRETGNKICWFAVKF